MDTWKKIRGKHKTLELLGIIGIVACIIIGSICDWHVLVRNNILIEIDDIESFSLTIIEVQATLGALIIAIIALITGNISDSYMGVPISEFYLNIRPWKLTQKTLIIIALFFSLMGLIAHALNLYNIVFYIFIATIIVILVSILEIYAAFKGKNKQNQEIEAYINYIIEAGIKSDKKCELFENFVEDWEKDIEFQDKQSYEKYLKVFEKFLVTVLDLETEDGLSFVEQQCYSVAYCLLWSDKITVKERGLEFIHDVYEYMWSFIYSCIREEKVIINKYKKEFPFFAEISNELMQNIDVLNMENVEKRLKLGDLIDLVHRCAVWFKYIDETKNEDIENIRGKHSKYEYNYSSEINEITSFSRYIGFYLKKQQNKGNIIDQNKWADVLNRWSLFSTYNIPEERVEDFLRSKVITYFSYCYGLLLNGQENIIKQGLYITGMGNSVKLDNKYQALLYICVHCYIYYLAEKESDECVSENIRNSARLLWTDEKVKNSFLEFLNMLAENSEWLDMTFLDQILSMLDRYELFPKDESSKMMIMDKAVSDFYLFLILFMQTEFWSVDLLENNIDDMRAFRYVSGDNESKTKEIFKNLYISISMLNKEESKIDSKIDLMYNNLETIVKKKQKERYIESAKEAQKNYENNINEDEICKRIKDITISRIKEKFASIMVEDDEKNGIIKVGLLSLSDYTSSLGREKNINSFYSDMEGSFLYGIVSFLVKRKVVEFKSRFSDFKNDEEFMEYLTAKELSVLLGSRYIMKNKDWHLNDMYDNFIENRETIFTSLLREGIALKRGAVQVCLHDVNVSIHPLTVGESNAKFDEKSKKYSYSILDGLSIDFEEDELREFLYNNRKVIDVTAKVSIQVNEDICGTIFTGNKYF